MPASKTSCFPAMGEQSLRGHRRGLPPGHGRDAGGRGLRHPLQPRHRLPRNGPRSTRRSESSSSRRRIPAIWSSAAPMLASCFVDKNFNDLAVQWYARGHGVERHRRGLPKCGLLYELGSLLVAIGEPDAARATVPRAVRDQLELSRRRRQARRAALLTGAPTAALRAAGA